MQTGQPSLSKSATPGKPSDISDKPFINFLHRHFPELLVTGYLLLLVYCSLLPFQFVPSQSFDHTEKTLLGLSLRHSGIADILFNIAVYAPLGAGTFSVVRRRGNGRVLAGLAAMLLCFMLSFAVEQAQRFDWSRVATWLDVISNSLGGTFGVIAATILERPIQTILRREKAEAARNWWLTFSKVFVCAVLLVQIRPFDLATDLKQPVKNIIQQGGIHPLTRWNTIGKALAQDVKDGRRNPGDLQRMEWEYVLDRATEMTLYAITAALVVIGLLRDEHGVFSTTLIAGYAVHVTAGIVMLVRILLISHGLDTAIMASAFVGWLLGSSIGVIGWCIHKSSPAITESNVKFSWPQSIQRLTMISAIALVSLYGLAPFDLTPWTKVRTALIGRTCAMPFRGVMGLRPTDAFNWISSDLLRYGCLGAVIAIYLARSPRNQLKSRLFTCATLACALSAAMEITHIFMPSRHVDVTHLILAIIGALSGTALHQYVIDFRASISRDITNDRLTSELISGPTYQPIDIKQSNSPRSDASRKDRAESQ